MMRTWQVAGTIGLIALGGVRPAGAQQPQPGPQPAAGAQIQARQEMAALEGILENAVRAGAQLLTQHVQNANVPDMVMLTGMARARGFRLDGYGVVFDVEFPSIRRSVMWSMRALVDADRELLASMRELRNQMQAPQDAAARQVVDANIKDLESQIRQTERQAGGVTAASAPTRLAEPVVDLRSMYFNDIGSAVIDAILDHGAAIGVAPDDWLSVAARESADRGFMASDPNDTAMTFILRIKGSDLQAFRERRLSRDEARARVDIKRY